jgi:hypothetical protein
VTCASVLTSILVEVSMKKVAGVLIATAIFACAASAAMNTAGAIRGVVKDPSGAVVPGAVITVFHRGQVEVVSTNQVGEYEAASLAPGRYAVRVESKGFSPLMEVGLVVMAGQKTEADASLSIQPLMQEIAVTGAD